MPNTQYTVIADYACHCGENPLWHPLEQMLYWTDIPTGRLFRYSPATGDHEQIYHDRPVGGFTIQPDGALLLFRDKGNVVIWRDGEVRQTIIESLPDELDSRFNDVIADPEGRVFCGTISSDSHKGRLYRLDPDGSIHRQLEGISIANGMAFTVDDTTFYFTDTPTCTIYRFDYDRQTGEITNQHPGIQTNPDHGRPDGCTIDEYGDLWSAHYGGSGLYRYSTSTGDLKEKYELPTSCTTSLTFAGPDFNDIYVTSAGGKDRSDSDPHAGALFRLPAPVPGRPEYFSRIGV